MPDDKPDQPSPPDAASESSEPSAAVESSMPHASAVDAVDAAAPPPFAAAPEPDPAPATATPADAPPSVAHAPIYRPLPVKRRDLVLTLVSLVGLAGIMWFHNTQGVTNPRGDDPAHPLGHYATLIHSGHIPGGVILGTILTILATVGLLGLLGDSPLDLRGDETRFDPASDRPLLKREGTWLVGLCALLYLPLAGAFGLWDPWETHYAEVAREVLARDDWITLWWGQEGWFMSKPILIFWMSALGMGAGSTFGLPFWRDMGPAWHEWCIRVPICLFAIFAVYMIYRVVRHAFGRRAGFFAGVVLATMPHWFFLTHQAMTDMPFVAPLVVSISFLIIACTTAPEKLVAPRAVQLFGRTFRISFWHLAVGAIILVALPQVLYLLTRPVMLSCPEDADRTCAAALDASRIGRVIQFPIERYWSGSAANSVYHDANATVPGSPAWEDRYNQVPFMPSFVQGLIWLFLGALILGLSLRRERSQQSLSFSMMYLFGAISFMGKGPAGLGVPEIVLLGFMLTANKWNLLWRIRFMQGIGIYLLCGFPWYIAIYCRLGNEFFDRFVVHDLLNRAFAGVHGDTGTFRYFVWQLGYAMFPWTGLVPAALVGWRLMLRERATEVQRDVLRLSLLWFVVAFTLFSLMITKFHHYIFPAVPSVALMVGVLLYRMVGNRSLGQDVGRVFGTSALLLVGTALSVIGCAEFFGRWTGSVPTDPAPLPHAFLGNVTLGAGLLVVGVAMVAASWWLAQSGEVVDDSEPQEPVAALAHRGDVPAAEPRSTPLTPARFATVGHGVVAVGAVVLIALVARDIGTVPAARPAGFERFIHLFVYNYDRPFPTRTFEYTAILRGFGIVAVLAAVAMVISPVRRHGVRTLFALATCFAVWGLDKYMIDLSHHWSQRNLFERYYARRHTRDTLGVGEDARYWADPLVAYQMNWKGENFYTGNHAAMLECGLPLCHDRTPDWLGRHRGQHIFFVTEHSRSGSILGQVRTAGGHGENISTELENNKFVLIEAQL